MEIKAVRVETYLVDSDWSYDDPSEELKIETGFPDLDLFLEEMRDKFWFKGCAHGSQVAVKQASEELSCKAWFVDDCFVSLSLWDGSVSCSIKIDHVIEQAVLFASGEHGDCYSRESLLESLRTHAATLQAKIALDKPQ